MKPLLLLLLSCAFAATTFAQKNKKTKSENYDSTGVAIPSPSKKGKSKTVNFDSTGARTSSKNKSKAKSKGKLHPSQVITDYVLPEAKPDTTKNFTGIIKYRMTSDDPSSNDSIFIIFGRNKVRVRIFIPGYREDQFFENSMIANFSDSSFIELDTRQHTYTIEKLTDRNNNSELNLMPDKNFINILNNKCAEYKGTIASADLGESETACLLSPNHYFNSVMDYNFMGIHPIVVRYQITLGFRSKDNENESTYIMAYKIEPGNTDVWFDLSQYKPKK